MALRNIRIKDEDDCLRKISREVTRFDDRLKELIDDMKQTMYEADGVGLAAVQVGVVRRLFVVDIYDGDGVRVFINPTITSREGTQVGIEGCLSVPDEIGIVERPMAIEIEYLDETYQKTTLKASGFLARAICHEYDHIEGILYTDRAIKMNPTEEEIQELTTEHERELRDNNKKGIE